MRALRVLGTTDGGRTVLCDDPTTGDQFAVAVDGTLRAALRGERPAAERSTVEATLTPKEIQARVRAGAGIEELAAEAGTSLHRIERFAYPVLLERATAAEKARRSFPTVDGLPANQPLEDLLTAALVQRGLPGPITWDAYRDGGAWILVATWAVGHSTARATWEHHPGPGGGSLTARDDTAAELVDPALRVLRPLRELKAVGAPDPTPMMPGRGPAEPSAPRGPITPSRPAATVPAVAAPKTTVQAAPAPAAPAPTAPVVDAPTAEGPARPASPARGATSSAAASKSGRRPVMPSWEDVLLGTRSKD